MYVSSVLYLLLIAINLNNKFTLVKSEKSKDSNVKELAEDEYDLGYGLRLVVNNPPIASTQSEYQNITLYTSVGKFGKILVIDECIQLTELDAPNYNEMLAHVGMMSYQGEGKNVAVIGGGDGYIIKEILKHPYVKVLDHIELDPFVVKFSKDHFPWGGIWDEDRVTLHLQDGALFMKNKKEETSSAGYYDVIIQDTSDPFVVEEDGVSVTLLPSSVLYTHEHFSNVYGALSTKGVFVFQAETYNVPSSLSFMRTWRNDALKAGFVSVRYGTIAVPSYPTGQIGFFLCTKMHDPPLLEDRMASIQDRFSMLTSRTKYYHPKLQTSCFDLPLWVEEHIYGDDSATCDSST